MAHRRPPLIRALQLNTLVLVVEIAGGIGANSFSLIMDGVHNVSDEVALVLLVLAYSLRTGLSGKLLRFANLFNSIGLLLICAFLIWRVVERISNPVEVFGLIPVAAGLIGSIGNWGVAKVLREPSKEDAAIRLAYVHNLGDTLVSLIPVAAGVLVLTSGSFLFDSLFALLIAAVVVITTLQAVIGSHKELLWPENVSCGHPRQEQSVRGDLAVVSKPTVRLQNSRCRPSIVINLPRNRLLPADIRKAPDELREAYRFAIANRDTLRYIPCYCGCGTQGHTSNASCYFQDNSTPEKPIFDRMSLG